MKEIHKQKGRGVSAMRIIMHRRVHELHTKLIEEEGDRAKYLPKSFFADKISDETGYKSRTVSLIMNRKPE